MCVCVWRGGSFWRVRTRDITLPSLSRDIVAFKTAGKTWRCCFRYLGRVFEHVLFFRNCDAVVCLFAIIAFVMGDLNSTEDYSTCQLPASAPAAHWWHTW